MDASREPILDRIDRWGFRHDNFSEMNRKKGLFAVFE